MESVYSTPIGRVYRMGDRYYSSVTTILSGFRTNQVEFYNDYATIGTRAHYEILGLYDDMEPPESVYRYLSESEVNHRLDSALEMWETLDVGDVVKVEYPIKNDKYLYAGRVDMLTCIDEELVIADLKTGNYYKHYPMQLAAYWEATREKYPKLSRGVIYQIDLNEKRNPEHKAQEHWYELDELKEEFRNFAKRAKKFEADQNAYIEKMAKV